MGEYKGEQDQVHKICMWCPVGEALAAASMAEERGSIIQQGELPDGAWYMELLPEGCGKGAAIREWCGLKHILPGDTMSFGDGRNDIDMMKATGLGVAMGDGDEELKRYASSVCGAAAEDGIYRELVRRGVIAG